MRAKLCGVRKAGGRVPPITARKRAISTADAIQPPDAKVPKVGMHCTIRIGRPIKVDRYQDRADDRLVLRQITDELMFEIRELTGQEYRDVYATKKSESIPSETARVAHVDDPIREPERELVGTS